jgi:hypothetical protein
MIVFSPVKLGRFMLTSIVIRIFRIDGFSVALTRDLNSFARACVLQITLPAAADTNIQHEAVCIDVVKPSAGHDEVACERTVLQGEQGS